MQPFPIVTALSLALGIGYTGPALARDKTPPVMTPTIAGTQGTNGWYTGDVTLTWTISDPESKITRSSGCGSVTLAADTSSATYSCTATSAGGSSTQTVTLKRDATAPNASILSPVHQATYTQNQAITARYSCVDATAGIAACSGSVTNDSALDLSTAGSKTFSVQATDKAGNNHITSVSYTVVASTQSSRSAQIFAWNDLGMHCVDSDFSVFTLLPPFNDLNAQLVVDGKLINAQSSPGYTLTYESTPDLTGSVNSSSSDKTNFWDYDQALFGANLPPERGLTGNPMASFSPAPLTWNTRLNIFEATGIPITPTDDQGQDNPFPMVKVSAIDSGGRAITSTQAVLPVSSEINCNNCHASNSGSNGAQPAAGWVNLTHQAERDWRMNVLRLHDEKNSGAANYQNLLTQKGYGVGLESSATQGQPILCDGCHNSNALAVWGINGETGVSNMTAAMHNRHAQVSRPGETQTLDSIGTREACYNCHPGKNTECLRGAMGNPVDATGKHLMECQSCHGSMSMVGNRARQGWFDMPTCQSCHHDGQRETVAINADGRFKTWSDSRFASNPDTPAAGWSLYRFSTGHGQMQCAACHNSTHAEFTTKPSANGNQVNDNLRAIQMQGYAAAIRECTSCHVNMPNSVSGGPHGMHEVGQSWVTYHHDAVESATSNSCAYCHGSTRSGSALATIKIAKTFNIGDGRTKSFAAEEKVTCWSCHDGPKP